MRFRERDLPLLSRWMNDPAVAAFWELSGPPARTADHVRAQLTGDGHSVPCLGILDGTPMSYWEIYRADLDPLARHYPARPYDTGLHVLIGAAGDRGRGLGSTLLAVALDAARRHRLPHVWLGVWEANQQAIGFYRSQGFEEFGAHTFRLGDAEQRDLLMRRPVG